VGVVVEGFNGGGG